MAQRKSKPKSKHKPMPKRQPTLAELIPHAEVVKVNMDCIIAEMQSLRENIKRLRNKGRTAS